MSGGGSGVIAQGGSESTVSSRALGGSTLTTRLSYDTGGFVATGSQTSTGGRLSSGGTTATGGTKATGGAETTEGRNSMAGAAGSGCHGSFEAIQRVNGHALCVAKMVPIAGPASDEGSTDYQIDATEVTRGQYNGWVATNPPLPLGSDVACGWKSSGSYAEAPSCTMQPYACPESGCDHYPVTCVDWCDAYYYCAAVGKRLCGKIGGGSNAPSNYKDASANQWYRACSSAGANKYPYGHAYESQFCIDSGEGAVGTLTQCQSNISGYTGAYDLSGNVWEWEDSCEGAAGSSDRCRLRGGGSKCASISGYVGCVRHDLELACDYDLLKSRSIPEYELSDNFFGGVGFRCCSR